jgi:hypothetical protein
MPQIKKGNLGGAWQTPRVEETAEALTRPRVLEFTRQNT